MAARFAIAVQDEDAGTLTLKKGGNGAPNALRASCNQGHSPS